MINDPALNAVVSRLLSIEAQLEQLRADVATTDAQRTAEQARPPTRPEVQAVWPPDVADKLAHERRLPQTPSTLNTPLEQVRTDLAATDAQRTAEHARPPKPTPQAERKVQVVYVKPVPERRSQQPSTLTTLDTVLSGRGLAVTGLLLMLIGCACFLDLSFTRGWIGPSERIALGLIAGSALIAASARFLRGAYRMVAEGTVGLGAGVLYLSTWAAIAVFPDLHISRVAAFATMTAVTCVLALIANKARSQPIALMGLAGAYLTPVLLASGTPDRTALAAYLLIVTSAMLTLARRRAFVAVEATAIVATLFFTGSFVPDPYAGWSDVDAATVASLFFLIFATAFTRPMRGGHATPMQLVPCIFTTAIYIASLECIFQANQTVLGAMLLGLATLLFGTPAIKRFPAELKPAYRCLAVLALNLAMRALLQRTELFDAFSIEAAVLVLFGARTLNVYVTRIGIAFFAIAAVGLLWEAATLEPAHKVLTPLALGFLIWIQSAFSARRAIPRNLTITCSIIAHGVALVGLTRVGLDATGGGAWCIAYLPNLAQFTISMIWALFAAGLFGRGATTRNSVQRWEGLTLFAVTIVKVFTVDLASLDVVYRILAFAGTGVVLFVSSAWYTRSLRTLPQKRAA